MKDLTETKYSLIRNVELPIGLALYKLELIGSENIPQLAITALDQGYDSSSLRILAGLIPNIDNSWEINDYFKKSLIELGIEELSSGQSCLVLIRYYLQQIIDGTITPFDGLEKIIKKIYYNSEFQSYKMEVVNKEYKHNYLGIEVFYGLYYQYDDHLIQYSGIYNDRSRKYELRLINKILDEAKKYIVNYENIKLELIESEKYLELVNSIEDISETDYNELIMRINDSLLKIQINPIICENTKIKGMFGNLDKNILKYVLNKDHNKVLRIVIVEKDKVYFIKEIQVEK